MIKSFNIFAAVTVTALALSLAVEPAKAAVISVYQTFDTQASAAADGWATLRNTANSNNYGWDSGNVVSGTGGQAGGIFTRTISGSTGYYADLTIGQSGTTSGTLDRATETLSISGLLNFSNVDFDGSIRLGYFNSGAFGNTGNSFIGLNISEPVPSNTSNPFRVSGVVASGTQSTTTPILINQNQTYSFGLTWTPTGGGAGTLSGNVGGTPFSLSAPTGSSLFDAFGITNGWMASNNSAQNTNGSYFDNITYSVVPEPTQMVFVAGVGAALGAWRLRKLRQNGRGSEATAC
jgi:hypothetical protein